MIQRIQSIYLLIVSFLTGILSGVFEDEWLSESHYELLGIAIVSCLSALGAIFLFKNRKTQLKVNGLNIFFNVIIVVLSIYYLLNLPGGMQIPEKGIEFYVTVLMGILAIVFLILANKAIKKDEELVKSVDRIR